MAMPDLALVIAAIKSVVSETSRELLDRMIRDIVDVDKPEVILGLARQMYGYEGNKDVDDLEKWVRLEELMADMPT